MPEISVVIITFNEEKNIARCLDSVKNIADEIVVVDSYSTDSTKKICLERNARFMEHVFEGHIQQKNFAMQQAKYNYVLSLDADEALSKELEKSLLEVKKNFTADAYSFNRLTNYCGKWIRHGGWYPDIKTRLWDRTKGKWGGVNPHDKVVMQAGSATKHLQGELLHYSYYTVEQHWLQAEKFSTIAAEANFKNGKRSTRFLILFSPVFKFIRDYIFKLGFLDGLSGFRIARIASYEKYLKYRKMLKLQQQSRNNSNK